VFTVFGENLGPAQSPPLSFPLSSTLGGVSIGVTQSGATTQAFPIFVSAGQINAVMPSTVNAGLATLRLTYQANKKQRDHSPDRRLSSWRLRSLQRWLRPWDRPELRGGEQSTD
jgi:uncharacterized protein (TIGR03437 family)